MMSVDLHWETAQILTFFIGIPIQLFIPFSTELAFELSGYDNSPNLFESQCIQVVCASAYNLSRVFILGNYHCDIR